MGLDSSVGRAPVCDLEVAGSSPVTVSFVLFTPELEMNNERNSTCIFQTLPISVCWWQ